MRANLPTAALARQRQAAPRRRASILTRKVTAALGAMVTLAALILLGASPAAAAGITADPSSGQAPLDVQFSYDGSGECDDYRAWDFGDDTGSDSQENSLEHTYTEPGTYVVVLTIYYCESAPGDGEPAPCTGDEQYYELPCTYTTTVTVFGSTPSPTPTASPTPTCSPSVCAPDDSDEPDDSDDADDSDDSDDSPPSLVAGPPGPPVPSPTTPTKPIRPSPTTPTEPTAPVDPTPTSSSFAPGESSAIVALMILGAVIGSLGRVGGLAMAGRRIPLYADRDDNTVARHVAARDAEGWGDRSFTWRLPGHRIIDAASMIIPDRFARFSPLAGRVTEDGSEFRAILGTLWLAAPLAGIALGIAAVTSAGANFLPPALWLLIAGALLATFDAFSGALAVIVFGAATLVGSGATSENGPDTVHALLVMLAIGFLWMAIPLVGSAIRPFRRLGDGSFRHRWDVTLDGIIAALLCGWVAQKVVAAMDLFAGQATGLPEHANTVAIVVMGAVLLRVVTEHFAMAAYPRRLQSVEGEDPPLPFLVSIVTGAVTRTAVFGFIGWAFIGSCWQLWLGVGLFLVLQLIEHVRERFRNFRFIQQLLPRGVIEIFILVVACTIAARFAMERSADELEGLRLAFLFIAIPPTVLAVLRLFSEDSDETSGAATWPREILGAIILVATVVLALQGWDY